MHHDGLLDVVGSSISVCCVCFHWVWWRGAVILFSFVARRIGGVGVDFLGFGFGGGVRGGRLWLKEKVCVWWHRGSLFRFWLGVVE